MTGAASIPLLGEASPLCPNDRTTWPGGIGCWLIPGIAVTRRGGAEGDVVCGGALLKGRGGKDIAGK